MFINLFFFWRVCVESMISTLQNIRLNNIFYYLAIFFFFILRPSLFFLSSFSMKSNKIHYLSHMKETVMISFNPPPLIQIGNVQLNWDILKYVYCALIAQQTISVLYNILIIIPDADCRLIYYQKSQTALKGMEA